jgi:hypothetical protein
LKSGIWLLTGQPGVPGAVAIGNAAIHAARGLVARLFLGEGNDEFAIAFDALGGRRVFAIVTLDLEKTCDLAH